MGCGDCSFLFTYLTCRVCLADLSINRCYSRGFLLSSYCRYFHRRVGESPELKTVHERIQTYPQPSSSMEVVDRPSTRVFSEGEAFAPAVLRRPCILSAPST